ncbi:hypothetical protein [Flavobacterium hercynium]|uniref:Lipoprotein n=1 Tax=Flavobacterium hercynium TaxID=387094 RepID=A0A226GRM4_9FLAO|nr:hypothetical protein [Flavobacterium hercynium]OXA84046.1 hypothetical protein B0A66_21395 [Flavobacterium hercynium]SMP37090.1 hypothetical protein SAMN06265346_12642 [Flavobacterium hercynium]
MKNAMLLFVLFLIISCKEDAKKKENNIDLKANPFVENSVKDSEDIIEENKSETEKSLKKISGFEYIKYRYKNLNYIESIELANFLNARLPFFIEKGGGVIEESNFGTDELVLCESKTDSEISNKRVRYVFIDERIAGNIQTRDTLRIAKGLDYSQVLLDPDKTQFGICIGKYSISKQNDQYFEISSIYSINEHGKLIEKSLNTIIYDCPAPSDYISDEEPNSYNFGIKGGKKFERYWYQN